MNKLIDGSNIWFRINKSLTNISKLRLFSFHNLFYSGMIVLLLFLNIFLHSDVISLLTFFLLTILIIFLNSERRNSVFIFSLFFTSLFHVSFVNFSLFTIVVAVFILRSSLDLYVEKKNIKWVLLLFPFLSSILLSCIVNLDFGSLLSYLSYIAYFIASILLFYSSNDYHYIVHSFSCGFLISCLISFPATFSNYFLTKLYSNYYNSNEIAYIYISGVKILRFSGLSFDPNFLAFNSMVAIFSFIFLAKHSTKNKSFIYVIFSIISLFFGLLTFSKMFSIIIFLYLIYYLISYMMQIIHSKNTVMLILSFISIGFPLIGILLVNTLFNRIVNEISFESLSSFLNSLSTYRYMLNLLGINDIFSSPIVFLFGKGLSNYCVGNTLSTSHNTFLQTTVLFGVVGFVSIFGTILFVANKKLNLKNRLTFYEYWVLFLTSLMMLSLPLETYDKLVIALVCILIIIYNKSQDKKIRFSQKIVYEENIINI